MSDSVFSPAVKPSPRGFARTVVLGGLLIVAAMTMQNANFGPRLRGSFAHRDVSIRFIDASQAQSPIYDEEHGMSSSQLLNRWDAFITEASQRFHVPKAWIRAVMRQESGGRTVLAADRPIVSHAGALGLMQVMPATYDQMAQTHRLGSDPLDAHDNILAGAAYLRWLHERYGYPRMFAAYNAGPGRVAHGKKLPAETRAYVGGITRTLKTARNDDLVHLTRPDGATVKIKAEKVTAIRQPMPGEYPRSVKAVLTVGRKHQAVRENVQIATAAIRATGGLI